MTLENNTGKDISADNYLSGKMLFESFLEGKNPHSPLLEYFHHFDLFHTELGQLFLFTVPFKEPHVRIDLHEPSLDLFDLPLFRFDPVRDKVILSEGNLGAGTGQRADISSLDPFAGLDAAADEVALLGHQLQPAVAFNLAAEDSVLYGNIFNGKQCRPFGKGKLDRFLGPQDGFTAALDALGHRDCFIRGQQRHLGIHADIDVSAGHNEEAAFNISLYVHIAAEFNISAAEIHITLYKEVFLDLKLVVFID